MDDDVDQGQAVAALGALAQDTRLEIVRFLVTRGPEGAAAGAIARHVGASTSRASFHLANLERAGLIASARDARRIVYRARFDRLGGLIAYLLEDCCQGSDEVRRCCR